MSRQKTSQVIYSVLLGIGLLCAYGWTYKSPTPTAVSHSQIDQRLVDVQQSFRG